MFLTSIKNGQTLRESEIFVLGCGGDLEGKRLESKVNQARPRGEEGTGVGGRSSKCQAELDSSQGEDS